jgi:hypothetical protein
MFDSLSYMLTDGFLSVLKKYKFCFLANQSGFCLKKINNF